jgi:hypothetical protein
MLVIDNYEFLKDQKIFLFCFAHNLILVQFSHGIKIQSFKINLWSWTIRKKKHCYNKFYNLFEFKGKKTSHRFFLENLFLLLKKQKSHLDQFLYHKYEQLWPDLRRICLKEENKLNSRFTKHCIKENQLIWKLNRIYISLETNPFT